MACQTRQPLQLTEAMHRHHKDSVLATRNWQLRPAGDRRIGKLASNAHNHEL